MRIGVSLREPSGPDPMSGLREQVRQAASDGFASAWLSNIFGLDALTALAVAGNQVGGIELGTAVVPTYPRHPAALAQQALTAAAACGGRLVLGIGVSHKIVIEDMYGYDFDRPVRHMREYLAVLLPLLERRPASFTGATVRANLTLTTPGEGRVPLLLAALGTQMLRLAGQQADGTILWMTGPATVRDHVAPAITEAALTAGRPAPRIVCILPVCVTSDLDGARERAARVFAVYGELPSYRAMLDREGAAGPGEWPSSVTRTPSAPRSAPSARPASPTSWRVNTDAVRTPPARTRCCGCCCPRNRPADRIAVLSRGSP